MRPMTDFLTALGLVLVIEGLLLAGFPNRVRQALEALQLTPDQQLRILGLGCAVVGLIVVWLIRG